MLLERFIDVLIDANIFVLMAAFAFLIVEACLVIAGYRKSYATRLWLLTGSLCFAAILPILSYMAATAPLGDAPHVQDILISQYLQGNLAISAVNFDSFLSARTTTLQAVHSGSNLWITTAVTAVLAAIFGRIAYIAINMVRITRLIWGGHTIKRAKNISIIVSSNINVPFSTRGFTKFFVVVPQSLLMDSKTLAIAIGHEFQHIRQRDVTIEFLLALCSPFFIFNPGFWVLSQKLRKLREHTCDIEYLHRSRHSAKDYANALLVVAKQATLSRRHGRIGSLSVPFIGRKRLFGTSTKSSLAGRMLAFADGNPRKPHKYFAASLMVAASTMILFGTAAFLPSSGWSHDRIMISSVANLERLSLRNSAISPAIILSTATE